MASQKEEKINETEEVVEEKVKLDQETIQEKEEIIVESKTSREEKHNKEELNEAIIVPEGYKIYRDKTESFVCDMEITGANPSNSKARIIIESKDLTYMFEGIIDAQGKCKIPLRKMNFLDENETGVIKLEVIADDTVFTPWEDNFVAVNSKKVAVKVFESAEDNAPKIGVRLKSLR